MIIYGFYGTGKTTACEKLKEKGYKTLDLDEENFITRSDFPECYKNIIKEDHINTITFTNARSTAIDDTLIDIAFLPKNIDITIRRLEPRHTDVSFIENLKKQQTEIFAYLKDRFKNKNIIWLDKNEFIETYISEIIDLYEKETVT